MRVTVSLALAIIDRERPHGWGLRYSRKRAASLSGECGIDNYGNRYISLPALVGDLRHSLFLFFHECYHARTWSFPAGEGPHVDEYNAERYAINMMHEYGLGVRRKDLNLAKNRVRQHIARDSRKGIRINGAVRRWSRG